MQLIKKGDLYIYDNKVKSANSAFNSIQCNINIKGCTFSDEGTTVTIRNTMNQAIENLLFTSIDDREEYIIAKIDHHTNISFKYKTVGANGNAVNLRHISNSGDSKNYSIIRYVIRSYSYINIDINSVEKDGELNIEVDVSRLGQ